jgi:hypothetical protein
LIVLLMQEESADGLTLEKLLSSHRGQWGRDVYLTGCIGSESGHACAVLYAGEAYGSDFL